MTLVIILSPNPLLTPHRPPRRGWWFGTTRGCPGASWLGWAGPGCISSMGKPTHTPAPNKHETKTPTSSSPSLTVRILAPLESSRMSQGGNPGLRRLLLPEGCWKSLSPHRCTVARRTHPGGEHTWLSAPSAKPMVTVQTAGRTVWRGPVSPRPGWK